jgi:plasmid stabilization system protein ParE
MRLILHPNVKGDVQEILDYYRQVGGEQLEIDFYRELQSSMQDALSRPELFAIRERDIRRVNLSRFPYHFLFRITSDTVRVLVVRHHRRHPSFGMRRR